MDEAEAAFKCPAPAGMIPGQENPLRGMLQMPRTCGDDPGVTTRDEYDIENAPHLRG